MCFLSSSCLVHIEGSDLFIFEHHVHCHQVTNKLSGTLCTSLFTQYPKYSVIVFIPRDRILFIFLQ